jgi:hypothetical protein
VTRLSNHKRVRRRINRTFQLVRMPANMTVIANVMAGALFGADPMPYKGAAYEAARILGEMNLLLKADHRLDQLTYIEQKRVELARALATRPRVLLLDEWLAGLDPSGLEGGMLVVRSLAARGIAVILVEPCHDGGADTLQPRGGDECRWQDRRGPAGSGIARSRGDPRLCPGTKMLEVEGLAHRYGRHERCTSQRSIFVLANRWRYWARTARGRPLCSTPSPVSYAPTRAPFGFTVLSWSAFRLIGSSSWGSLPCRRTDICSAP